MNVNEMEERERAIEGRKKEKGRKSYREGRKSP